MKIAILSDIHSNKQAFDAVYKDIEMQGCEHILILGDIVGYYYDAEYVVNKIMSDSRCISIKGNHEAFLLKGLEDESVFRRYKRKYGSGLDIARQQLSEDMINWIKGLPESKSLRLGGMNIEMHHGSDKDIEEYIYPDESLNRINQIEKKAEYLFYGHTHYPVSFYNNGFVIVNPGSVGQPRDIGGLASYVILNIENNSVVNRRIAFETHSLVKTVELLDADKPYLKNVLTRNNHLGG